MSGTAWDAVFGGGQQQPNRAQRRQRDKLPEWRRFDRQQKKARARARAKIPAPKED